MAFTFERVNELTDGQYLARVESVDDIGLKSGEVKTVFKLTPYDPDTNEQYEEVTLWSKQTEKETDLIGQLFDAIGEEKEIGTEYNAEKLDKTMKGKEVGIIVKVNVKNGKVYNNVTEILDKDDLDDDDEDDLDDDDEDDLDDDDEDDLDDDDDDENDLDDDKDVGFSRSRDRSRGGRRLRYR